MKFIIDAHLPKSLAFWLRKKGFDTIHTLDLPNKNATSDLEINEISIKENRIVISKDADFYNSYFRKLEPHKLIYLKTGNIPNKHLLLLFENNFEAILDNISTNYVVEVSKTSIIVID